MFTEPFISINLKELNNYNNLEDISYSKFESTNSACPNYSYLGKEDGQAIKNGHKYSKCLSQIYNNLIIPKFLFFSFELRN